MRPVVVVPAVFLAACDVAEKPVVPVESEAAPVVRQVFTEFAQQAGLDFVHENGASGSFYFPEIMGAGVALSDYDDDGDLDIYVVQGAELGTETPDAAVANRLYRNDWLPAGELRFTDVSNEAGIADTGYGMGAAVADWDNDGDQDVYVTNLGPNVMYRNNGDGSFSNITSAAEERDQSWSTSASFVDYDRDGDLDLYVANYVTFTVTHNVACTGHAGQRDYCDPNAYSPQQDRLWRNDDGTFVDVSDAAGIAAARGNGLGVVAADFNNDGWPDLYVANDQTANLLWVNQQDGTFVEDALMSGSAYNADGQVEASMGVTAGDYDGDGDDDLFMTHLRAETNTIYRNSGKGSFADVSDVAGLSAPSLGYTGFGASFFDVNNDGWLDLFSANGSVQIEATQLGQESYPFLQRNQLFIGSADGRFVDVSASSGDALQAMAVSRGAAFGDIDNDGDTDIVVSNNAGPLSLLVNNHASSTWLSVRVAGVQSNRDGTGARVAVLRGDSPVYWRRAHTDGSYLSASDRRVHFGLANAPDIDGVLVRWPTGSQERWPVDDLNREILLTEGSGQSEMGVKSEH